MTPTEPRREDFRDFDGWAAWRKGLFVPAETSFTLVRRGAVAARFQVAGHQAFQTDSVLSRPLVDFRARGSAVTAVLALDVGDLDRPARRFVAVSGP